MRSIRSALVGAALAALPLTACDLSSPNSDDGASSSPTDSQSFVPPPPPTAEDAGTPPSDVDDRCPAVGGIPYERPRPNVMLLVDRSGSMADPGVCDEATCPSKWQQLLALGGYLSDIKGSARLGLSVFPTSTDDGCATSSGVMVPLTEASDVDQQILSYVSTLSPGGRTPIAGALDELAQNGGLNDPSRDNVAVLLTDGMPNCACSNEVACEQQAAVDAVGRLIGGEVPVRLHVVGFGASASTASDTLTAMAAATGAETYYQADTIESLIERLYQIAVGVAPCRFTLDEPPPPDELRVWLDDALVAPCTTTACDSGYTYDQAGGVVELHGTSCAAIRDGQCHNVWFDTTPSE